MNLLSEDEKAHSAGIHPGIADSSGATLIQQGRQQHKIKEGTEKAGGRKHLNLFPLSLYMAGEGSVQHRSLPADVEAEGGKGLEEPMVESGWGNDCSVPFWLVGITAVTLKSIYIFF